jgi:hypothetical protein
MHELVEGEGVVLWEITQAAEGVLEDVEVR